MGPHTKCQQQITSPRAMFTTSDFGIDSDIDNIVKTKYAYFVHKVCNGPRVKAIAGKRIVGRPERFNYLGRTTSHTPSPLSLNLISQQAALYLCTSQKFNLPLLAVFVHCAVWF